MKVTVLFDLEFPDELSPQLLTGLGLVSYCTAIAQKIAVDTNTSISIGDIRAIDPKDVMLAPVTRVNGNPGLLQWPREI